MACLLVMMLGGCGLYFGGGGGGGSACYETPPSTVQSERDPYTGQCESVANPQCGACEPCVQNGIDQPNWASCSSSCLGKDVSTCEAVTGCQAEYLDTSYWGCFPVEPNPAPAPGACSTLNLGDCTSRDDCIAVYTPVTAGSTSTKFLRCDAEVTPPPPPACTTLTTESDCLARSDCDAVYTGSDCTCDSKGCVCQVEVFASCETR